jgi:hypothetical protein
MCLWCFYYHCSMSELSAMQVCDDVLAFGLFACFYTPCVNEFISFPVSKLISKHLS